MTTSQHTTTPVPSLPRFETIFWNVLIPLTCVMPAFALFFPRLMGSVFPIVGIVFAALFLGYQRKYKNNIKTPDTTPIQHCLSLKHLSGYLVAILLLCLTSSLWSVDSAYALERCAKIALLFLGGTGFLYVFQQMPATQIKKLGYGLIASLLAVCALVPFEFLNLHVLYKTTRGLPIDAPIPHSISNRGCTFMVLLLWPILLFFKTQYTQKIWPSLAFLTLVLVINIFFSRQHAATIGLSLSLFVFLLMMSPLKKYAFLSMVCSGALFVFTAPWLFPVLYTLLSDALSGFVHLSASIRLEIWDAVSNVVQTSLFYGHGIEAARHIPDFPFQGVYYSRTTILHPHNILLQTWLEFGVLGILLLSIGLVALLRHIWDRFQVLTRACAVALVSIFALVAVVDYGIWQSWWMGIIFYTCAMFHVFAKPIDLLPSTAK